MKSEKNKGQLYLWFMLHIAVRETQWATLLILRVIYCSQRKTGVNYTYKEEDKDKDKDLFIGPQEFVVGYSKAPEQR